MEATFDFSRKGLRGSLALYLFTDILLAAEKGLVQKFKMIPFSTEKPLSMEDQGSFVIIKQSGNKIFTITPKKEDKTHKAFFTEFETLVTSLNEVK